MYIHSFIHKLSSHFENNIKISIYTSRNVDGSTQHRSSSKQTACLQLHAEWPTSVTVVQFAVLGNADAYHSSSGVHGNDRNKNAVQNWNETGMGINVMAIEVAL